MMAYQSNYVVSVIQNNKPLREFNTDGKRVCKIPFGAEYTLRIKNKTNKRAMVRASIDGTDIITGARKFILEAYDTLDVERFVDDLVQGKRFKFISIEEGAKTGQIQDPTSPDNGLIRVEIFPEYVPQFSLNTSQGGGTIGVNNGGGSTFTSSHVGEPCSDVSFASNVGATPTGGIGGQSCLRSRSVNLNYNSPAPEVTLDSMVNANAGATVEGSTSLQQFGTGAWFPTEINPIVIDIWLRSPAVVKTSPWRVDMIDGRPKVYHNGQEMVGNVTFTPDGKVMLEIKP